MAEWKEEELADLRARAARQPAGTVRDFWVFIIADRGIGDVDGFLEAALGHDPALRHEIRALLASRRLSRLKFWSLVFGLVMLTLLGFLLLRLGAGDASVMAESPRVAAARGAEGVAWNELGAAALEKGRYQEAWLYSMSAMQAFADEAAAGGVVGDPVNEGRARAVGRFFRPAMAGAGDLLWQSPTAFPAGGVAVAPEAGLVAVGSLDHHLRLLDMTTGARLRTLAGHGGPVRRLAISRDGVVLVSIADDGGALVWDVRTSPALIVTLDLGGSAVLPTVLAMNDAGSRLLIGDDGGGIHLFGIKRLASGLQVQRLHRFDSGLGLLTAATMTADGHQAAVAGEGIALVSTAAGQLSGLSESGVGVNDLLFLDGGRRLVTAENGGGLTVLDTAAGKVLAEVNAFKRDALSLAWAGGTRFVAGGRDGGLGLWDGSDPAQPVSWLTVDEPVFDLAWAGDAGVLLSVEGDTLLGRDAGAEFGVAKVVLEGHDNWLSSVAYDGTGAHLASTSLDGTVRLWDGASGRERLVLRGHQDAVWDAVFSPDGGLVYSASSDGTVRVWDTASGAAQAVWRGHQGQVNHIALSPDGVLAATASHDGTVRLWRLDGSQAAVLRGHEDWVWSAAFDAAGARLATVSEDRTVRVWDVATGASLAVLRGHQTAVRDVAFHPVENVLATVSGDQTVRLWDLTSGEVAKVLRGHKAWVFACAFSPDGHLLATASEDQTVKLWDVASGVEVYDYVHAEDWTHSTPIVRDVVFHPEGNRVATAFEDGRLMVWAVPKEAAPEVLTLETQVRGLAWRPSGDLLAVSGRDGVCLLLEPETGRVVRRLTGHTEGLFGLTWSPNGRFLATTSQDETVRLWDLATQSAPLILPGQRYWSGSPAFSPDGALLASGSADFSVALWDVPTGHSELTLRGHEHFVSAVAFHPAGKWLATASHDRTVALWDLEDGRRLRTWRGHGERVYDVAFSPDGDLLASASADGTVRLWDPEGGARAVLRGHRGAVFALAFQPDGRLLYSASNDRTVRVWDPVTGDLRATLGGHDNEVIDLAFSPDGGRLVSGGDDYRLRFYGIAPLIEASPTLTARGVRLFGYRREGFRFTPDPKYRFKGVNGYGFPSVNPLDALDKPRPVGASVRSDLLEGP